MTHHHLKPFLPLILMALAAMGPSRQAAVPEAPEVAAPAETAPKAPEVVAPAETAPEAGKADSKTRAELTLHAADEIAPADLLWQSRPVVVFADSPNDPSYLEQMKNLTARPGPLLERDVVVIVDTDPDAASAWRRKLHPRGFSLVVIDKDGQVKLRRPFPWDVREISRAIDRFPLRRQEIGRAGLLR